MFIDLIRSCATYLIFFFFCGSLLLPGLALLCIPPAYPWVKILYAYVSKGICKFLLLSTFLPVTYQGFDYLPQTPTIFVANHQSSLDILLVGSVLGTRPCTWLAKSELFEYPLLKNVLSHIGIPVYFDKKRPADFEGAVKRGVEKLAQGFDVVIFAEGGRYNDGTIHQFYSGFAAMAKLSGAPVVPLFISGAGQALAPGYRLIRRVPLTVTVGSPFFYNNQETVQLFKERVYDWFVALNAKRQLLLEEYGIRICQSTNLKTSFDDTASIPLSF